MDAKFNTGLTQLDMKLSGGYRPGMVNLIGDSDSGKTMLAVTAMAATAANKDGNKMDFIYNHTSEFGMNFDVAELAGEKLAEKLETESHQTVEDFFIDLIRRARNAKRPFFYVLDSMDGVVARELKNITDDKVEGKKGKGSFGAEKAKVNSQMLQQAKEALKEADSFLIIISQTREDIGSFINKPTRTGGKALKFYSDVEMWMNVSKSNVEKHITVNGTKKRLSQGTTARLKIAKNHYNGFSGELEFSILSGVGVDDTGNIVDYLIDWGVIPKAGSYYKVGDLIEGKDKMYAEKLKEYVDENDKVREKFIRLMFKTHKEVMDKMRVKRKRRY